MAEQPTYQCSGCHKRFFADGFDVNRLGSRYKSCKTCVTRSRANVERNKCEHGRNRYQCKDCGTGHCKHGRVKSRCHECDPCAHGHHRSRCVECGATPLVREYKPALRCEHSKITYQCAICKPKMSDPDWARGFRNGRNHLTDEELTKVLAEFGF
jgi:hypothetical protein